MQKEIIYKKTKICYHIIGTGRAVFLIHGFGEDASVWYKLTEVLKNQFQVLVIDLPGTGNSEFTASITDMDALAEIVNAILEYEKISLCTLLGHSMGGYISLCFAKKYKEKLQAIGLLHSTAFADSATLVETRKKSIAFIKNYGSEKFLQQTIPNLFAPEFVKEQKDIVADQIQKSSYINDTTLIAYIHAMMNRKESLNWLSNAAIPVLFIIGKKDYAVPYFNSLQQCHLPKISYIHVLQQVGHMGMLEATEFFNKKIKDFLQDDIY